MSNENTETEPTQTDIFQQQKKTIDTLVNILAEQGSQPQQIVYAAPAEQQAKPPNYLLYIGIGILAILLFKK